MIEVGYKNATNGQIDSNMLFQGDRSWSGGAIKVPLRFG